MNKKTQEEVISPSQFMRKIRPELYSDSAARSSHQLNAEVLSHHLDTITERNQTHEFELFCRKLCERTICPNLRPATGPEGGGDSKADTETTPVADEITNLVYVGIANRGSERWAFAFSAKKKWPEKARSDVAGIVATNRGYTKIFVVTSRAARAKDRARVEDDLSREHGVQVTIHDRSWIIDEIIDKNRRNLAYNYLGIGNETCDLELGPSDYSRKQQLTDVERELSDPAAFVGMPMQRAAEALVAAKLARALELPRAEVDGRFLRAVRLADDGGTHRQQLVARYETLLTAFWWFDDLRAIVDGYDGFEALVIDSEHAVNLEMLCDLAQLLFNAVLHQHISADQAKLQPRIDRLSARLAELAADPERPNNALEAKTSLLIIYVNEAVLIKDSERLSALWPQFADILANAKGLAEFDATRLARLIEVFGKVAGKDRGYRDLVDQLSDFVAKRAGESQGALILLKRAGQLDLDDNMEMIRILGKAARLLSKKEHAQEFVEAHALLSVAYQSAGLLWAARASSTSAIATLFIESDDGGALLPQVFPLLMNVAWQTVELKYFPEVLEMIRIARGCLSSLPFDDASKGRATEQLWQFDLVLACQITNLPAQDVSRLVRMPDILLGLGLDQSRSALLYVLGYEGMLRSEGWIPEGESAQDVAEFFNKLAGQPAGDATWRLSVFNEGESQVFATLVLGVQVNVIHVPSDTSVTLAEAIIGTIEAFFATAFELEAFAHVERFDVIVVEDNITRFEVIQDEHGMGARLRWPSGVFPGSPQAYRDFNTMLLEIASTAFVATCHVRNFKDAVSRLFGTDAAIERAALIASICLSRKRIFGGVSRLTTWDEYSPEQYDAKPDRPRVHRKCPPSPARASASEAPSDRVGLSKITDHRNVKVHSIIDVRLWERAGWAGAAYGTLDPRAPPFLALMFEDREAAEAIFQRWANRFGKQDRDEEIHIGVVRRFSAEHPTHYGMIVTSRFPDESVESQLVAMVSRSLTMEPSDNVNLEGFLDDFSKAGAYLLMPMVLVPGKPPLLIREHYVLKRVFHVKLAADVEPHEPESIFLKLRGLR